MRKLASTHVTAIGQTNSMLFAAMMAMALLFAGLSGTVLGALDPPSGFAGRYAGIRLDNTAMRTPPTLSDIHLKVSPRYGGFVLRFQSLSELTMGIKHHYEVVFKRTWRPGIYLAGMRCDVFGHPRPLDPALGDPYMWVYLEKDALTLYAMSIASDGTHDLGRYSYRRNGDDLALEYQRLRDDWPVEWSTAVLRRVAGGPLPVTPAADPDSPQHPAVACG